MRRPGRKGSTPRVRRRHGCTTACWGIPTTSPADRELAERLLSLDPLAGEYATAVEIDLRRSEVIRPHPEFRQVLDLAARVGSRWWRCGTSPAMATVRRGSWPVTGATWQRVATW